MAFLEKMMMCLTLGIFLVGTCFCQNQREKKESNRASSSYNEFKSRSKTSDLTGLLKEADGLKTTNPSEALDRVQDALGLSIAQKDVFAEAKCYVLLGEINENIQEWKLSFENYDQAYQRLAGNYASTPDYRRTLQGLGMSNMMLEKYDEALKNLGESLQSSTVGDPYYKERKLDISEVYYRMGNYNAALKNLDDVTYEGRKVISSFDIRLDNLKAKINARLNATDKTGNIYDNSINALRSNRKLDAQETQSLQTTKDEIADALRGQNKSEEEIKLRNQSIEFNLDQQNMAEVANDKVEIGKALDLRGETNAAIKEVEEAVVIADTIDNPVEQAKAFLAVAELYDKSGKSRQALTAYKKYSQAVARADVQREIQLNEKSVLITKQKAIQELTSDVSIGQREETIELATVFRQQLIIYGLLVVILLVVIAAYFIYRNAMASKEANQLLALKSLRSQMNPHFIFNALNSVNHFIAEQDERTANKFLSEFSQLMRLVLENSQEDFIPLNKEQEILSLYLKLEHYRFRDKFDYEIDIDKDLNADTIDVPPMLIQPYIENAVWHGLRYKESKGKLTLRFQKERGNLIVEITDDGIGRQKSAELKTENQKKHNSTGLKNIQQRLEIINKVYKANYKVVIDDLAEGSGTRVRITLPVNGRINDI